MASGGVGIASNRIRLPVGRADLGRFLAANLLGGNRGPGSISPPRNQQPQRPKPSGGGVSTPVNQRTGGQVNQGGTFNPVTSSFGLDLRSNAPFDPLNPGALTVGGFNKQVLSSAQPQYLPQLQQIQGEQAAEKTATGQRTSDLQSIYTQYQQQAQDAYNQVQKALADLANETGAGSSQANLAAALGSAVGGQNQLAQMMGMSAQPGQAAALPYTGAGQAATTATQDELNTAAAGALGLQGENLSNVGNERATELNTESLRHQAAEQGLQQQQGALVQQIPGIIEKARQQLVSDLQNAQSLRFQENLAGQQFGLQSQAQAFNQAQTKAQFKETQINDAANRATQAAQLQQNAQALQNQQAATQTAAQQAIAKAQGQDQVNAIKYLQSWLAPTKDETRSWSTTDASGTKRSGQTLKNPNAWHRDVGSALRSIMQLYGLQEDEALRLMEAVGGSTFVSGQGGQTVADWARTFRSRQQPIGKSGAAAVKSVGQSTSSGIANKFKF